MTLYLSLAIFHSSVSGQEPLENMDCFLKARLNVYNRRRRDFAVAVAGEGTDFYYCISLTFAETMPLFGKKPMVFSTNILKTLCRLAVLPCYSFPCTKQVSKTKQNEHLVKMLLRSGVDVNATDSVSGFIQMQMWLTCRKLY